jgi:hypothetical protein
LVGVKVFFVMSMLNHSAVEYKALKECAAILDEDVRNVSKRNMWVGQPGQTVQPLAINIPMDLPTWLPGELSARPATTAAAMRPISVHQV